MNRTHSLALTGFVAAATLACAPGDAVRAAGRAMMDAGRLVIDSGEALFDAGMALVDAGDDAARAQPLEGECTHVRVARVEFANTVMKIGSYHETRTYFAVMDADPNDVMQAIACDQRDYTTQTDAGCDPSQSCSTTGEIPTPDCAMAHVQYASGKAYVYCGTVSAQHHVESAGTITHVESGSTFQRARLLRR